MIVIIKFHGFLRQLKTLKLIKRSYYIRVPMTRLGAYLLFPQKK